MGDKKKKKMLYQKSNNFFLSQTNSETLFLSLCETVPTGLETH